MLIERTRDEIIIRLPASVGSEGLERIVDYLKYKEATSSSKAKQAEVDKLTREIKKGWWKKNRPKYIS